MGFIKKARGIFLSYKKPLDRRFVGLECDSLYKDRLRAEITISPKTLRLYSL